MVELERWFAATLLEFYGMGGGAMFITCSSNGASSMSWFRFPRSIFLLLDTRLRGNFLSLPAVLLEETEAAPVLLLALYVRY